MIGLMRVWEWLRALLTRQHRDDRARISRQEESAQLAAWENEGGETARVIPAAKRGAAR